MKIAPDFIFVLCGIAFLLDQTPAATAATSAPTATNSATTQARAAQAVISTSTGSKPAPKLKTPEEAADDILKIISDTRADSDYVGPNVHSGLLTDLSSLETAADAVRKDDKKDAGATEALINKFIEVINQTIGRANSIRNRAGETAIDQNKSQQLQKRLSAARVSFHPDVPAKTSPPAGSASPVVASGINTEKTADSAIVRPGPIPSSKPALVAKSETTAERLTVVQTELKKALAALNKSVPANHGGFIEKARTDATRALEDLTTAIKQVQEHPELNTITPGILLSEKQKFSLATIPSYEIGANGKGKSPNMDAAVDSLNAVLRSFIDFPKDGTPRFLVGEINGARDKILADICQVNDDVLSAFEYAHNRSSTSSGQQIP